MQVFLYYLIAFLVIIFYGTEVCPFLETLGTKGLALNTAFFIWPAFLLRLLFLKKMTARAIPEKKSTRFFSMELSFFFLFSLCNAIYNLLFLNFPIGSGLKLIIGYLLFGFFAAMDNVLIFERSLIKNSKGKEIHTKSHFFSLPKKFALVTAIMIVFISAIMMMLILKDFAWLEANLAARGVKYVRSSIIKEIFFVLGCIFLLALKLLFSYSRNLRLLFINQTNILEKVTNGQLEHYVPVITNDEFGMIAGHTNNMIDGLKEKRRIKDIFGKLVNPSIAELLLKDSEKGTLPESKRTGLTILFSDIRSFTSLTEKSEPEWLVKQLNRYFSLMVPIINRFGGIVDKFIGDGMLAVFGLNGQNDSQNQAVKAGKTMLQALDTFNEESSTKLNMGIGIHSGDVIAGLIGSPERLEYTVIGDVVNTAARLESLNKTLGTNLLISEEVYNSIKGDSNQLDWQSYGAHQLKGKSIPVNTFGISIENTRH